MWSNWQHDFINYLRFEKRYSAHTVKAYEADLQQFAGYLKLHYSGLESATEVRHYHIRSWLASLKTAADASAATINRKRSTLNSFYKFGMRQGLATANPARLLHAQRRPGRLPTIIQPLEAAKLLEEADFGPGFRGATERLVCELLYTTGLRRAELSALRETDVEWSSRQLRVLGKGSKERLVPLGQPMLAALRDYIARKKKELAAPDRDRLLVLENGRPLYDTYIYRVIHQHLNGITTGAKKSPHVLRHSFATHLLANGANIQAISELLGHSSLAATQVYTHSTIEQLREVHRRRHPRG